MYDLVLWPQRFFFFFFFFFFSQSNSAPGTTGDPVLCRAGGGRSGARSADAPNADRASSSPVALPRRATTPVEVPMGGRVIRKGVADWVPAFDRLFTLDRLFYLGRPVLCGVMAGLCRCVSPIRLRSCTGPIRYRSGWWVAGTYTRSTTWCRSGSFTSVSRTSGITSACCMRAPRKAPTYPTVSEASRHGYSCIPADRPEKVTNSYQALPERRVPACRLPRTMPGLGAIFDLALRAISSSWRHRAQEECRVALIEAYRAPRSTPSRDRRP